VVITKFIGLMAVIIAEVNVIIFIGFVKAIMKHKVMMEKIRH